MSWAGGSCGGKLAQDWSTQGEEADKGDLHDWQFPINSTDAEQSFGGCS